MNNQNILQYKANIKRLVPRIDTQTTPARRKSSLFHASMFNGGNLHGNRLLELPALLNLKHEITSINILHYEVQTIHGLETRMKLNQERRFAGLSENSLLHHRAFNVVVLNNDVLFKNFDCVKLVGAFAFRQHYFSKRALSKNHQKIEVRRPNHIFSAHVVWHVLVGDDWRFLSDGSLTHLYLELRQILVVVGHGHIVELTFLCCQELEPSVARILDDFRNAKR